jgi:hypothetical protein
MRVRIVLQSVEEACEESMGCCGARCGEGGEWVKVLHLHIAARHVRLL